MNGERFPVVRAGDLDEPDEERRWLVESILPRAGVSICGGAPKCCKTWMGLDLALSIASGTPCLDRFVVAEAGPVLIYLAEDPPPVVRDRLDGLCLHRGLELSSVPLDVITAPTIRLDLERDQERLAETVRALRPRLLLLDPFVRLHRLRENDAGDVSVLLGYLRALQREHDVAVMVVHHARKSGAAGTQNGQGLRGSGDFYAFVDTLLYLRRRRDQLLFSVEHRAARAPDDLVLELFEQEENDMHLAVVGARPSGLDAPLPASRDLDGAVLRALRASPEAMSARAIRAALHCRTDLLNQTLERLHRAGEVECDSALWCAHARTPTEIDAHCAQNPSSNPE